MDATQAVRLINSEFVYPPRMNVRAEYDEWIGLTWITTTMDTYDSGSEFRPNEWKRGYQTPLQSQANFAIRADRYGTPTDLLRKIISLLMIVQEHEIREFMRLKDGRAPFHPHTSSGQLAWGHVGNDMNYGRDPGMMTD